MAFVLHLLRPGEHFVDVGANIGSYTVLAAGAAKARVTAIEPVPATFSNLERNVSLNGLASTVKCWPIGLADVPGKLRFSSGLDTVNHVLLDSDHTPCVEVPVMRLDDIIGDEVPVLVKIDVEGYELPVLKGAAKTLSSPTLLAVILETNGSGAPYGVADHELVQHMRERGFACYTYDPFARKLDAVSATPNNTVFVRNRPAVEARCTNAKRFRLVNGVI